MCSTSVQRIAEFGQAIDELSAQTTATEARNSQSNDARTGSSGDVVTRLAELWAQLAELDPEVARRLPTYEA
jgi:hypothetical protein